MLVAEKIFSLHSHFTADSLLDMFKDRRDEISKATIYRIIGIMVEGKLLIEHDFGKDYKFYEHIIGHEHHDHIICRDCGRIVEFVEKGIEDLQEKIASQNGFSISGHSLNIYGTCMKKPNCEYYQKSNAKDI
jgi:Fur family transcriptional regulator, ferric uptake regulator